MLLATGGHGGLDLLRRPFGLVPQDPLRQLHRFLHPHAAVREIALRVREQAVGRGVVQVHVELVREHELHQPQGVLRPRPLADLHPQVGVGPVDTRRRHALAVLDHLELVAVEIAGIAQDGRDRLFPQDARRHVPVRAEDDLRHLVAEDGRGGLVGLPRHHPHREGGLALLDRLELEGRDVDEDVAVAELLGQPPPALEVQLDLRDAIRGGGVPGRHVPVARQLALESEVLRVSGKNAAQRLGHLPRVQRAREQLDQVHLPRLPEPVRVHLRGIHPAPQQVRGVLHEHVGQAQIGLRHLVGKERILLERVARLLGAQQVECLQIVILGVQTLFPRRVHRADELGGFRARPAAVDPSRGVGVAPIEAAHVPPDLIPSLVVAREVGALARLHALLEGDRRLAGELLVTPTRGQEAQDRQRERDGSGTGDQAMAPQ